MVEARSVPPPIEEIREVIREVCGPRGLSRVDLFGSVARGSSGPGSDVDLLVEFLPESEAGLFEMGALQLELEERLGCRVDVVSRRAIERSRNHVRRASMLESRVPLYVR